MKEFNLEEAKSGKPVCTRDGNKARILCFDAKGEFPIYALIEVDCIDGTIYEYVRLYRDDGKNTASNIIDYDLMMED
jgi:hypothetical protein